MRPTRAQLQALRAGLPPLGEGAAPSAGLEDFCAFYGIDFAARDPRVRHTAGSVQSAGYTLAVHCWQRADAVANLLLVHGYFDHTGLFGKLVEWGLAQGCNVLAFDLPGHGLSSGEPAVIDEFHEYGRAIADVLAAAALQPLPLWVMGQSTGCAALVEFARGHDWPGHEWPFAATVLLAPLVRPTGWRLVRLGHALLHRFTPGVPRGFARNSSDERFLDFIRNDPLQSRTTSLRWVGALRRWLRDLPRSDLGVGPALVVQGEADETVDWRHNLGVIAKLFPGSRIELLPGAGHQLANESGALREQYLSAVKAYLVDRGVLPDR